MVFTWNQGSRFPVDAQAAGEALDRIRANNKGYLTPDVVVRESRSKKAPLHPCFEWDDEKAAELHRAEQARLLIRSVRVIDEASTGAEAEPSRVYVNVDMPEVGSCYVPAATVMSDKELRRQVLEDALGLLKGARKRLAQLQGLARVHSAFETLETELTAEINKPIRATKSSRKAKAAARAGAAL